MNNRDKVEISVIIIVCVFMMIIAFYAMFWMMQDPANSAFYWNTPPVIECICME